MIDLSLSIFGPSWLFVSSFRVKRYFKWSLFIIGTLLVLAEKVWVPVGNHCLSVGKWTNLVNSDQSNTNMHHHEQSLNSQQISIQLPIDILYKISNFATSIDYFHLPITFILSMFSIHGSSIWRYKSVFITETIFLTNH